jgi:hypothetical protein
MSDTIEIDDAGVSPSPSTTPIRRLVTGVDESGRSVFVSDEVSPRRVVARTPTFVTNELWRFGQVPVDNTAAPDDGLSGAASLAPAPDGGLFRIVEFPPDTDWMTNPDGPGDQTHATPSLDLAVILRGTIWAVLDAEEREMSTGDVLIQRGTVHAWANRGTQPCLIAFALIGGTTAGEEVHH